jgi:hypothetical protein
MLQFDPRAFWSSALDVLLAFRRTELCDAVTPQLVDELALLLEEMIAGRIPEKVEALRRGGAPSVRPVERRARAVAAAYVRFARRGLIQDGAPVATIQQRFGIARRTATLWANSSERGEPWLPSARLPEELQAKSVHRSLDAAADEYARKGRAQANRVKMRNQQTRTKGRIKPR